MYHWSVKLLILIVLFTKYISLFNPLKPDVWERSVGPGGGPQGPPFKVNEGVV